MKTTIGQTESGGWAALSAPRTVVAGSVVADVRYDDGGTGRRVWSQRKVTG